MTQRYFRTANDNVYESVRLELNAKWMLPNDLGTVTCFAPASNGLRDSAGLLVLAVDSAWCDHPDVDAVLPSLLEGGLIEEVGRAEYLAAMPQSPY